MSDDIKTGAGTVVGQWDGKVAADFSKELQRILSALRSEGSPEKLVARDMPHRDQIPEDLRTFKAYTLWGCDLQGMCVVGAGANRLEPIEKVRSFSLIDHH